MSAIILQLEYLLRILVAALCGAAIGYERESRLKNAGIRTHLIAAIASALIMEVSKYGFYDVLGINGVGLDPSRIAAGVVTAIGFLGAGIIFVRKQNVSGVTTAAGMWATVGVGISIGAGMYIEGIAVTFLIIMVQIILHKKSRLVKEPMSENIVIRIEKEQDVEVLIGEIVDKRNIDILSMKAKKMDGGELEVSLHVRYPEAYDVIDTLKLLQEIPYIKSIEI